MQAPEGYKDIVSKSLFKKYSQKDKDRLGIAPTKKVPVFRQASWTLYRCGEGKQSDSLPVVLIPSLINKYYIMDLLAGHSLIESMLGAGLDVYLIDWGVPDESMGHYGFAHYVGVWVRRAIRHVKKISKKDKVQLVGQCIGGLMAALYAAHPLLSKDVEKLFLLTAPLDFEDSGLLSQWTSTEGFDVVSMTSPYQSLVPADFFHASFPLLDPKKQMAKYRTLLENYD